MVVRGAKRHMGGMSVLAGVHLHRWHMRRLPRCQVLSAVLEVERELVLVRNLRHDVGRVGRGHSCARQWEALKVLLVSEVHGRVRRLGLVLELAPSRKRVKRRFEAVIVIPMPALRRLDSLDV